MYRPLNVPDDPAQLPGFLRLEHENISRGFNSFPCLHLEMTYVAPAKPRDGDVYLADGSLWNPGSGAGYYGYRAGAWRFLG
jgi:hypothetical protein